MHYKYNTDEINDYVGNSDIEKVLCYINILLEYNPHTAYTENFFKNWLKVFKSISNPPIVYINDKYFKEDLIIMGSHFRFHYNISKANQLLSDLEIRSQPLSYFSERYDSDIGFIKFTYEDDNSNTEAPILLIPFHIENIKYLVIDGNHRVSQYIRNGKQQIDCAAINFADVINLMPTKFEKALYSFLCEINDSAKAFNSSISKIFLD